MTNEQMNELIELNNKMPNQRLGQLIVNAFAMQPRYDSGNLDAHLFYAPDDALLNFIREFVDKHAK